ncbi:MAG TPA: hypothetical protein VGX68_28550 [Thermoanaerobaculia bacterium]|jgi:anti-sigma factor RsiW|nr:hypothetical protein [Thermoanaerobaculia bacterium]
MKGEIRDERLRRILRETDSTQADAELTPEEIRAMRRAVLTSTPEPRRRWLWSPALAVVAMAVLAAIAILRPGMDSRATDGVPSGSTQKNPVVKAPVEPSPEGVSRQAAVPEGTTVGSPAASAAGGRQPRGKRILRDQIAATGIPNDEEPQTRQVQFSTPGGTRVIWILTTDKAL